MNTFHVPQKTILSFEIFPSNANFPIEKTLNILDSMKQYNPSFISVTYGAAGNAVNDSIEISSYIQNTLNIPALSHLTCVSHNKDAMAEMCDRLKENNIHNILALRGDRPLNMSDSDFNNRDFKYANEMIKYLNNTCNFNIAAAAYPEKHYQANSLEEDINHLINKIDMGVDFLITQLFFDNNSYYEFKNILDKKNVNIPISCGIMPVTSIKQLNSTISLSGSSVPKTLSDIFANYGDNKQAMMDAGLDYAINQINNLSENNVDGIHIYTMNRPKSTAIIMNNINL